MKPHASIGFLRPGSLKKPTRIRRSRRIGRREMEREQKSRTGMCVRWPEEERSGGIGGGGSEGEEEKEGRNENGSESTRRPRHCESDMV